LKNTGLPKLAFNLLDRITDVYPSFGPKIFQRIFLYIFGSTLLYNYIFGKYRDKLKSVTDFDKILIIGDVNIGDSLIASSCLFLVKSYYPKSRVDYVCNKTGGKLLNESDQVDNVFGLYNNSGLPKDEDVMAIKMVVDNGHYSLILNFSPFIDKKILNNGAAVLHLYIPFAQYILNLWKYNSGNLNISGATHIFIQNIFRPLIETNNQGNEKKDSRFPEISFEGNRIFISHDAIETAKDFLIQNNLYPPYHLLLYNPFVTSKYSMIPVELQLSVLNDLLLSDDINAVLIYEGNSEYNLESMILNKLPECFINKIVRIPNTISINAYAALIDFCDMFFSGDTGTVHVAASRKIPLDTNDFMRNRTSVVSVYGASDSRMYGYDSSAYGHNPANQDAPSKSFVGAAPCRTITCINRLVKTCKEVKCFHGLEASEISRYIISYFHNLEYSVSVLSKMKIYKYASGSHY
jgi:hypothetical protein